MYNKIGFGSDYWHTKNFVNPISAFFARSSPPARPSHRIIISVRKLFRRNMRTCCGAPSPAVVHWARWLNYSPSTEFMNICNPIQGFMQILLSQAREYEFIKLSNGKSFRWPGPEVYLWIALYKTCRYVMYRRVGIRCVLLTTFLDCGANIYNTL